MNLPPDIDPEIDKKKTKSKRTKTKFSEEEDAIIIDFVRKYGAHDWQRITPYLPGRKPRQARERWINYLNPEVSHEEWTQEEDDLLIEQVSKVGQKWSHISQLFKNRTDVSLKNRYCLLQRRKSTKMKKEFLAKCSKKQLNNLKTQINMMTNCNPKPTSFTWSQNQVQTNQIAQNNAFSANSASTVKSDCAIETDETVNLFQNDYFFWSDEMENVIPENFYWN